MDKLVIKGREYPAHVYSFDVSLTPYKFWTVLQDGRPVPAQFSPGSNLFQNLGFSTIPCPDLDYSFWRQVAISGIKNAYYYKYVSGGNFRLNGDPGAPLVNVNDATAGRTGLFFFDTANGQPPTDTNADGMFDNLTPDMTFSSGWNSGGFIFLNAASKSSAGLGNSPPTRVMYAPGEPWVESNGTDGWQSGELDEGLQVPSNQRLSSRTCDGLRRGLSLADFEDDPVKGRVERRTP